MRRRHKIFVLCTIFVLTFFLSFNSTFRKEEGVKDKVVEGGVLGGPVNIGPGRISVSKEEQNKSIVINSTGVFPSEVETTEGAKLHFFNNDSTEHRIGFYGMQKSVVLRSEYSYVVMVTFSGDYDFYVEYDDGPKEGVIKAR